MRTLIVLSCTVQEFLVGVCRSFILTAGVVSKWGILPCSLKRVRKQKLIVGNRDHFIKPAHRTERPPRANMCARVLAG